MTDSITTQIVGAHFRPPAKALLACLPAGHQLWLRPEPTNEWDENAVQVLLRSASLQSLLTELFIRDELERQLSGQGSDIESVLAQPEWHLGYLPRAAKGNKELEEWNIGVQQAIHQVCLSPEETMEIEIDPETETEDSVVRVHEREESGNVACMLSFDSAGKPTCIIPWPPVPTAHSDGIADGTLPQAGGLPTGSTAQCDLNGRSWLKISAAKAGQMVETDAGFTCIRAGYIVELLQDEYGLHFLCEEGKHYISGQADDGEHCIGLYPSTS